VLHGGRQGVPVTPGRLAHLGDCEVQRWALPLSAAACATQLEMLWAVTRTHARVAVVYRPA
jgi:hypothetical protein